MQEGLTFFELLAPVPNEKRTDAVHVLAALCKLQKDRSTGLLSGVIGTFLKQHLRKKCPRNVSDVLAKLPPFVERVVEEKGRQRWRITDSGLRRLSDITGFSLGGRIPCALDLSRLHPRIQSAAKELFLNGHYSEAVGRAAKELNRLVRERTGRARDDGVAMMHSVFADTENNSHRLVIGPLKEDWERDRQSGLRFMMAGCQSGIANVDKHGSLEFGSDVEALECLALVSHLARLVDRAKCLSPITPAEINASLIKAA